MLYKDYLRGTCSQRRALSDPCLAEWIIDCNILHIDNDELTVTEFILRWGDLLCAD